MTLLSHPPLRRAIVAGLLLAGLAPSGAALAAATGMIDLENAGFGRPGQEDCDAFSELQARCGHKNYCQFPVTATLCRGAEASPDNQLTVTYICHGSAQTETTRVGGTMTLDCR